MRQVHNQKQLKMNNLSRIFSHLREQGSMIKSDLAKELDLSFVTVSKICKDLVDAGYVQETDEFESVGGRKPVGLRFCPKSRYIGVIDLSLMHHETMSILDMNYDVLETMTLDESKRFTDTATYLKYIADCFEALQERLVDAKDKLIGVVIAIPGMVNRVSRKIEVCNNPLVENINLKMHMGELLNLPIYVENDANATALGYMLDAKNPDNIIYLHFTDGVGLGIVIERRIYDGFFGSAGELSAFPALSVDGDLLSVEDVVTLSKVLARYSQEVGMEDEDEVTLYTHFVEALERGDDFAAKLKDTMTQAMGVLLASLIDILNPQRVIVGGNWGNIMQDMIPKIQGIARARSLTAQRHDVWVENRTFDASYTTRGCGELMFQKWLRSFEL